MGDQKFIFDLEIKSSCLTWRSKVHVRLGDQKSGVQMSRDQKSGVQKFIFELEFKSLEFKCPEIKRLGFKNSFFTWSSKIHLSLGVRKFRAQMFRVQK